MLKYEVRGRQIYEFVGEKLLCDRAYIFEWNHSDRMRNTYEWCANGVVPQKHILQNESVESIQCLFPILEEKKVIVIDDMEQIGKQYPAAYAFLSRWISRRLLQGQSSGMVKSLDLSAWMSRIRV